MRKAAEDVAEWTCEGSLKSAGRVWLTGIPPLSRERVCLHTTEWTFLYVNLGGTAEVTGFCPMIRLYHRTEAFFIVSVRNEQTLDRNHAFDRIPKKNRVLRTHFFFPCIKRQALFLRDFSVALRVHALPFYEFAPQILLNACCRTNPRNKTRFMITADVLL